MYVAARALPPTSPESASVLPGAAHRLNQNWPNYITELRQETTTMLGEVIGESRLQELQTQGEVMDYDQAEAYALDEIAEARTAMPQ